MLCMVSTVSAAHRQPIWTHSDTLAGIHITQVLVHPSVFPESGWLNHAYHHDSAHFKGPLQAQRNLFSLLTCKRKPVILTVTQLRDLCVVFLALENTVGFEEYGDNFYFHPKCIQEWKREEIQTNRWSGSHLARLSVSLRVQSTRLQWLLTWEAA